MGSRASDQRATRESRGQWDYRGRRVLRERLDLLDQLESLEARVVKVLLGHKAALERLDRQALQDRRVTRALLEQRATRETPEPPAQKAIPEPQDRRDRWGRPL
jgi:hypothetical protein